MNITLEPYFDFIISKSKKVMLVIEKRGVEPQEPFILFDKKDKMALVRDHDEIIKLTYLPTEVLKLLKKEPQIIITEISAIGDIIYQYKVPLSIEKSLNRVVRKLSKQKH